MKFRTEYIAKRSALELLPSNPVILLGSCFTENIGSLMRDSLWSACSNPAGMLFNPLSISRQIDLAIDAVEGNDSLEGYIRNQIYFSNGQFVNMMISGKHWDDSNRAVKESIGLFSALGNALLKSDLILTFGTAWVYENLKTGAVVANCHKMPGNMFNRRLATVDEIFDTVCRVLNRLGGLHKGKVIFTVSPVRHLRDSFTDNSLSKATLLLATRQLSQLSDDYDYFPSFEIFNDDLRDYRWVTSDLAHPTPQASEYIWGKFKETYLSAGSLEILEEGGKLVQRLNHKLENPTTPQSKAFVEETKRKLADFYSKYPKMLRIND